MTFQSLVRCDRPHSRRDAELAADTFASASRGRARCVLQWLLLAVVLVGTGAAQAQGTKADYERSEKLRERTSNKVFRRWVAPQWFSNGDRFWYRVQTGLSSFEFVLVDAVAGSRTAAFDHAALAKALGERANATIDASKLPFDAIRISDDLTTVDFNHGGKTLRFEKATGTLAETTEKVEAAKSEQPERRPSRRGSRENGDYNVRDARSPDGKWVAFVKGDRVCVRPINGGEPIELTTDASEDDSYNGTPFYWSPDSRRLVALRTKRGEKHVVHFVESSPKEQLQPKLHSFDYLKPGDRIPEPKPHLFDIEGRCEVKVSDELFPTPWLDHPEIEWSPDSRRFFFTYNQRGHQVLRVIAVNAQTGAAKAIVNDESKTFIDYAGKQYLHLLPETGELIWMSERSGWNHLYLIDSQTGEVKNAMTSGEWVVRQVDRVDVEARQIWFRAGGLFPEQDPYYIHFCRVNFDGTGFTKLTSGDGTYGAQFSPDRRFMIGIYSRVDLPNVSELRRCSDGALICELEHADWSELLKTGWQAPERFVAKGRDAKTDIYGVIVRPTNFDPAKSYPVIEHIYAGPHSAYVPKAFIDSSTMHAIAELGFIVVQIDGMGTSHRSKAFHDVAAKNIGDSGFPDRILWMKAAARKYSYMDLNRVGIYGGSAGGQSSTRALLAFGDFYKVAVSDCGCHDNRMDKIWWNELWMGWPIGKHYEEQSNVTQAHRLQGKLLLIVGEMDRNVDPTSTMQVVNALIKADKDFDLLVVPGGGHGIAESPYGQRRRKDFFVRHLLGVEPRRE